MTPEYILRKPLQPTTQKEYAMPMYNPEVEAKLIVDAYDLGHSTAAKLVPGDVFVGAISEGRRYYETGSPYLRSFINGYLDGLPGDPITNQVNIIIEFKPR